MTIYDPPSGWKFGFPKPYKPLPGETLADTLRRDGYPEKWDPEFAAKHCRFWQSVEFEDESGQSDSARQGEAEAVPQIEAVRPELP